MLVCGLKVATKIQVQGVETNELSKLLRMDFFQLFRGKKLIIEVYLDTILNRCI